MIIKRLWLSVVAVALALVLGQAQAQQPGSAFRYPQAPRSDTIDDYHGTRVADPYRPLEDPDAPATRAWVEAENKITFSYLETIPKRQAIRTRLTALWDYEKFTPPKNEGGRYFYTYNTGLQNQSVLYRQRVTGGRGQAAS